MVDFTIYLYVGLFVLLVLASESIADLDNLGTKLSTEWVVSAGILSGVPQLMELILEYGAGPAFLKLVPQMLSNYLFFIFQNKTVASAMQAGISTGTANYIATGRPLANLHHTWRDNYIAYCYSHYYPALKLLSLLGIYHLLTNMSKGGSMPMIFTIVSAFVWLCSPVIFTPLPGITLLKQDIIGLKDFILSPLPTDTGTEVLGQHIAPLRRMARGEQQGVQLPTRGSSKAGSDDANPPSEELTTEQIQKDEKAKLRKPEEMRSIAEWGFTQELSEHRTRTLQMKILMCLSSTLQALLLLILVNGNILDHLYPFFFMFFVRWIVVALSFARDSNNLLSFFGIVVWLIVPFISPSMIGKRGYSDVAELFISMFVFLYILSALRHWFLLLNCGGRYEGRRQDQIVKYAHYFFCASDVETVVGVLVLVIHVVVALFVLAVETFGCCCFKRGAQTWWLLNRNVAESTWETKKQPFTPKMHNVRWRANSDEGNRHGNDDKKEWLMQAAPRSFPG